MLLDLVLVFILFIATAGMAYLGVHVSIHPPRDRAEQQKFKVWFIGIAVVALGVVVFQNTRNGLAQAALQKQLGAIESNTKAPPAVNVTVPPLQVVMPPPQALNGRVSRNSFSAPPTIVLGCYFEKMPILYQGQPNIYFIAAGPPPAEGFMQMFFGPTNEPIWPLGSAKDSLQQFVYRCEFANYSDTAVFNVTMPFRVGIQRAASDATSRGCFDEPVWRTTRAVIPHPIDRNGGKFIFYFSNNDKNCGVLAPPKSISLEQAGRLGTVEAPLKIVNEQETLAMSLYPRDNPR
jgi:hypothetical protein